MDVPAEESNGQVEFLVASAAPEDWRRAAEDARLSEELALVLLQHRQLDAETVALLAQRQALLKDHRVLQAVVAHPSTPRHVSLPLLNRLFTLELLRLTLMPAVKADIRIDCERRILARLEGASLGEKMTLAKQATGGVASVLLLSPEEAVASAALNNYHLTEAEVLKALRREVVPQGFFRQLMQHGKWRTRLEVQAAMLSHGALPLDCARSIVAAAPPSFLQQVVRQRRPRPEVQRLIAARTGKN
jgi:hypothetical protein